MKSNLEKEIDRIRDKYCGFESLTDSDVVEICKHFYKAGLNKNKLMDDALPGTIMINKYGNKYASSWSGLCQFDKFDVGDKIKIIVIEDDE